MKFINNNYMKLWLKIGLYLSSFSPLFLLLLIKEIIEILNKNWTLNVLNSILLIILFSLFVYGVLSGFYLLKNIVQKNGERIKVKSKTNLTDKNFLGYFSIFVLFAISFEIEMCSMAFIFFLIIFFIGVVYIKNDMYYINPFLHMIGYSYYSIDVEQGGLIKTINAYCNKQLQIDEEYELYNTFSSLSFLSEKD